MDFLKKLYEIWNAIPRGIQYVLVGAGLVAAKQYLPGVVPNDLTPAEILGGAAALAALHHAEDRLAVRPTAPPLLPEARVLEATLAAKLPTRDAMERTPE